MDGSLGYLGAAACIVLASGVAALSEQGHDYGNAARFPDDPADGDSRRGDRVLDNPLPTWKTDMSFKPKYSGSFNLPSVPSFPRFPYPSLSGLDPEAVDVPECISNNWNGVWANMGEIREICFVSDLELHAAIADGVDGADAWAVNILKNSLERECASTALDAERLRRSFADNVVVCLKMEDARDLSQCEDLVASHTDEVEGALADCYQAQADNFGVSVEQVLNLLEVEARKTAKQLRGLRAEIIDCDSGVDAQSFLDYLALCDRTLNSSIASHVINELGLEGFDAFTIKYIGNVSAILMIKACPDHQFMADELSALVSGF